MVSKDEKAYMELTFVRENSVSRQEKAKAFWKFLDARNDLQPHKGTPEVGPAPEAKPSVSSEDTSREKNVWCRGLEIFRQLGLDRIALATGDRCKLCYAEGTTRCEDFADTVTQPYEELNADIEAFQHRRESCSSSEALPSNGASTPCGSNCVQADK